MTTDPGFYADELYFPVREYQRRLDTLHRNMDEAGVDMLVVSSCINIHYLTGYHQQGRELRIEAGIHEDVQLSGTPHPERRRVRME